MPDYRPPLVTVARDLAVALRDKNAKQHDARAEEEQRVAALEAELVAVFEAELAEALRM